MRSFLPVSSFTRAVAVSPFTVTCCTVRSMLSASLTASLTACGHVRPDAPIRPANDDASSCVQIFA